MDGDTIAGVVKAQVDNPRPTTSNPSTSMPAHLVEGTDLDDVATYVSKVAGVPGCKAADLRCGPAATVFGQNGCAQLPHAEGGGRTGNGRPRPRQGSGRG